VAVAVAGDHEVGVDIVRPDERYPCREVAEFLFSPAERASLARAAAGPQHLHFFRIWALKEALLKARGGTAMMMKDTDTAAIAGDVTCDSGVPSFCRLGGRNFTLWWHALQNGHYCAIAAGMP
jgi:phosphopantetheine--protein transferase-like protein